MNQSKPNKTFTVTLTPIEAAILTVFAGSVPCSKGALGDLLAGFRQKLVDSGWNYQYGDTTGTALYKVLTGANSTPLREDVREIYEGIAVQMGYAPKPTPKRPNKRRMPDGKFANANYRIVKYPEHGTGVLVERHILIGDIAGDNVFVKEWDGKQWNPKTYKLSKLRG